MFSRFHVNRKYEEKTPNTSEDSFIAGSCNAVRLAMEYNATLDDIKDIPNILRSVTSSNNIVLVPRNLPPFFVQDNKGGLLPNHHIILSYEKFQQDENVANVDFRSSEYRKDNLLYAFKTTKIIYTRGTDTPKIIVVWMCYETIRDALRLLINKNFALLTNSLFSESLNTMKIEKDCLNEETEDEVTDDEMI